MKYQNVSCNTHNMHIKIFYGKCTNTFASHRRRGFIVKFEEDKEQQFRGNAKPSFRSLPNDCDSRGGVLHIDRRESTKRDCKTAERRARAHSQAS